MKHSLICVLCFLSFIACKSTSYSENTSGSVKSIEGGLVNVDDTNNGGTINVVEGQTLVIKLNSGSDRGATWTSASDDGLGKPSYDHDLSMCPVGLPGCSGLEVFTYKTAGSAAKSYKLRLVEIYFGRQPGESYTLTVNVSAN